MKQAKNILLPDTTAVRTALWRALHIIADAKPHLLEDEIGLKLIAPPADWQERPDMKYTKRLRASIIARARFIEDLVIVKSQQGINQYIILGSGLDTFAQRHPAIASRLNIYEIDQHETIAWKQQRLLELGFGIPNYLHFIPVDFETTLWWEALLEGGFETSAPAVIVCTGVTLYLTNEAIVSMLNQMSRFAPGSTIAVTFYLPASLLDGEDRSMQEIAEKGASAGGTPFISFFNPTEILTMANKAGLKNAEIISTKDLEQRYFSNRSDNLIPATGEIFLLAYA
jgi:methyltransferase (TIGR00027 family)